MIFASYGWERRSDRLTAAVEGAMKAAVWGTPDRVLDELEACRQLIGDFELNASSRFGGTPYGTANA
jgi:hypothetical protein